MLVLAMTSVLAGAIIVALTVGRALGQSDTEPFKQIQVDPFVDFSDLYAVTVLVSRKPMPELP